jgi:alkanesulfonate monooxygenase SsuD/methylene tetrahydromethanopterin reductase-like flavin-dependent oxidoreductase (luciferase family)
LVKLGLTLPSFSTDPSVVVAVARAAEAAGLDGVFVFDHLFRTATDGHNRPALEPIALLGALSEATTRITLGTLVARASLRPAASLRGVFDTLERLAPGRLVAGVGAGDSRSANENECFGLPAGQVEDRVAALVDAVVTTRDRNFPVWVGGTSAAVRAVASRDADGWNQWGTDPDTFRAQAQAVRRAAVRAPFTCSWGGLVVVAGDDDAAAEKAQRLRARTGVITGGPERVAAALNQYAAAEADWIIVGPVDSSDPQNATLLGEQVGPAVRRHATTRRGG